jgi:hypothetical protein
MLIWSLSLLLIWSNNTMLLLLICRKNLLVSLTFPNINPWLLIFNQWCWFFRTTGGRHCFLNGMSWWFPQILWRTPSDHCWFGRTIGRRAFLYCYFFQTAWRTCWSILQDQLIEWMASLVFRVYQSNMSGTKARRKKEKKLRYFIPPKTRLSL